MFFLSPFSSVEAHLIPLKIIDTHACTSTRVPPGAPISLSLISTRWHRLDCAGSHPPCRRSAQRYQPCNLLFSTLPLSSLSRPLPRSSPLRTSYFVSLRLSSVLLHYTHSYSCNTGAHAPLTPPSPHPPSQHPLALTHSVNHCPRSQFPRLSYYRRVGVLAPPTAASAEVTSCHKSKSIPLLLVRWEMPYEMCCLNGPTIR